MSRKPTSQINRDRLGEARGRINDKPSSVAFEPAREKFTLSSVDEPGERCTVEAQFNPRELQLERAAGWTPHTTTDKTNKGNRDGMLLEYGGPQPRSMQVELLFDGVENHGVMSNGSDVMSMVDALEALATIRDAESTQEAMRRPHLCVAVWGQDGMRPFRCVVESVTTKFQVFSTTGKVMRATCTVKLKEANVLGILASEGAKSNR